MNSYFVNLEEVVQFATGWERLRGTKRVQVEICAQLATLTTAFLTFQKKEVAFSPVSFRGKRKSTLSKAHYVGGKDV